MKESNWSHLSWNEKWNFTRVWSWKFSAEQFKQKMRECGFNIEKNNRNCEEYVHPHLTINISPYGDSLNIDYINLIVIKDKVSAGILRCWSYKNFGQYITDKLYTDILDSNWQNLNHTNNITEKFEELFFTEFKKYIDEVTIKVNKKNKKNKIKDKIQEIETEIDFAILNFYEEHKKHGIDLIKTHGNTQNVSLVYKLIKNVKGIMYSQCPRFIFRKMKSGSWEFYYGDSTIRVLKNPKTSDVEELLKGYFESWYNVPTDLLPKWTFSLDSISRKKNGD